MWLLKIWLEPGTWLVVERQMQVIGRAGRARPLSRRRRLELGRLHFAVLRCRGHGVVEACRGTTALRTRPVESHRLLAE